MVNGLEKLNNHTLLIGAFYALYVVDIVSSKVKKLEKKIEIWFRIDILFYIVIRNDLVLFGTHKGAINEYNPLTEQIKRVLGTCQGQVWWLIKVGKNKFISGTEWTIHEYEYEYTES